jgi:hypothetical protein
MPNEVSREHDCEHLPAYVPQVILDAMVVTLQLGYRYLWVDKYCISQNGNQDKHEQIRSMDIIYQDAIVTIVAASGEAACHGLPGISRPRVNQPQVKLGRHLYASSMPNPNLSIQRSKWPTRGWTYQEALLSRRRLVFTDHQVYFQCYVMHTSESIEIPLALLHGRDSRKFGMWNKPGVFPVKGIGQKPHDIWDRIAEYSERQLSYESDILDGILGIMHAFEVRYSHSRKRFSHIWGIPIWHAGENTFLQGLVWRPVLPMKRRLNFPSWSWTGWLGPISNDPRWMDPPRQSDVSIDIELSDGRTLSLLSYQYSEPENRVPHSSLLRFLRVSGPTVDVTVRHICLSPDAEGRSEASELWVAQVHLSKGLSMIAPFQWTKDVDSVV